MSVDPAWVALSLVDHLGARRLLALRERYGDDLQAAIGAPEADLRQIRGIGPRIAAGIRAADVARIRAALPVWEDAGIRVLPLTDPGYPPALAGISDPPATLFVRGRGAFQARSAAIVGTRTPSNAAREAAQTLAVTLANQGWQIVSGLALGVDAAAHLGALAVPSGTTTAVLGGGVLNIYPTSNRSLAQAVGLRGLLISETHPQADVSPSTLVARNRIITGLAAVIIIVETTSEGGAMHAARRASEQGRVVLTVDPAHLTGGATGNQALIDSGVPAIAPDGRDLAVQLP